MKKILFISGSIGLGHVVRDLEIARALRKIHPEIEISWMAESPASKVLEEAGEKLLPEANLLYSSNSELERSTKKYKANLVQWIKNAQRGWMKNAEVYAKISETYGFDVWVGDEAYDILVAVEKNPSMKKFPFVVIYDCVGIDTKSWNPVDHLVASMINKLWQKSLTAGPSLADKIIFIGELEDVSDKSFGFMRPNRRRIAEKTVEFVGYVLPEDIEDFRDKTYARRFLNYGQEPMILCSIGGTSVGKDLLDLCVAAYPAMRKKIENLRLVLVCGPRVKPDSIRAPDGVKVVGYVPNLYRHLGAADFCIVSGGGTITLELTALQRPFLYFPLKKHFEQEFAVAPRCKRYNSGIRMDFAKTTPDLLAEAVLANFGKQVNYPPLPINGAKNAAQLINHFLG